jgi:hypothetical protein
LSSFGPFVAFEHPVLDPIEDDLPRKWEVVQLAVRPGPFDGSGEAEFLRRAAISHVELSGLAELLS